MTAQSQKLTFWKTLQNGQVWNCYVDYHPDAFLAGAAEKAGISPNSFPCKTGTTIRQDSSVWAQCGYGAEKVCIFEKDLQETE